MTLAQINRKKYLKAPEVKQVKDFIKELRVSDSQFERFYGIAEGTICQLGDDRKLPAKYWHIIFERIVPAYGSGFLEPIQAGKRISFKANTVQNVAPTKIPTNKIDIEASERLKELLGD